MCPLLASLFPSAQSGSWGPYFNLLALYLSIRQTQETTPTPLASGYNSLSAVSACLPGLTRILENYLQLCHFESMAFNPYRVPLKTP